MKHRSDIDGLRAVAVIPVILFHAGVPAFSGGFVGVDVFFVISGFLITSIIIGDLDNQRFSLVDFYERRARRILPALSLVLAISFIVAFIILSPDALERFAQSLFSVTIFSSNIYFYLKSDYFSPDVETYPLLHTWSLAVEEQFYLFFPLLLMFLWYRSSRKTLLWLMLTISAASLALCEYLLKIGEIDANFYLITSRAWELMAGSIAALLYLKWNRPKSSLVNQSGSFIGLALIVSSIFIIDSQTPFPGIYAIPCILGTTMVLYFNSPDSIAYRVLSIKPMVGIGLISYSLYLWHQPIFAFLRVLSTDHIGDSLYSIAILLSLVLAYLSWRFVEGPFRNKAKFGRGQIFNLSALALAIFAIAGLSLHFTQGLPERYRTPIYYETSIPSPKRNACHTSGIDYLKPVDACRYFGDDVNWAVLGDSHVLEPAYALAERLKAHNKGLIHLTFSGCAPNFTYTSPRSGCHEWLEDAVSFLENNTEVKNILIGFRYTAFLTGAAPYVKSLPLDAPDSSADPREIYWRDLTTLITRLSNAQERTIYVLFPIPELPTTIRDLTVPLTIFHSEYRANLNNTISVGHYEKENEFILKKLNQLPWSEQLIPIYSKNAFCQDDHCSAVRNKTALYFDDNHPSIFGARELINLVSFNKQ